MQTSRSTGKPPQLTAAQQRAHDATVAILRRHCDEAEAHLRARAAEARDKARDVLCPCGIAMRDCRCPLQQAKHYATRA